MNIYLNGTYEDESAARIPVNDRGFLFGDGVYEVFRVIGGRLFEAEAHMRRLREGLTALRIAFDPSKHDITGIIDHLLAANGLGAGEATAYLQITRGVAVRTHEFPSPAVGPTVFVSVSRFKPNPGLQENGAAAITLPDLRWTRCCLKTVNLLPNVLAKQQAVDAGVSTAILIRDGMVTEAPSANVFCVQNGTVRTFPASPYILDGITRQVILRIARETGIPVDLRPVTSDLLMDMDEVFATGTTSDVLGITCIDGKQIGSGRPGPVTLKLMHALRDCMAG